MIEHDAEYWAEDAKIEFAVAIEQAMNQHGINRKQLAQRLNTSPAYVTKLLRGDANLTLASMAKTAHAMGTRLHIHLAPENHRVHWFDVISPDQPRANAGAAAWVSAIRKDKPAEVVRLYA